MIGIDANVVVRLLTLDPPDQAERARKLVAENDVFVSLTVILEAEWVLRDVYGYPRAEVADVLGRFCALERVHLSAPEPVRRALQWLATGLDYADALHLAQDAAFAEFATFDQKLVKRARNLGGAELRPL